MRSMSNQKKDEIKRVAEKSGRPLEVRCAMAFLRSGWSVRLGPYFEDRSKGVPRELDVLIEKHKTLHAKSEFNVECCVRILASCKGFPPDHAPLGYSISTASNAVHSPCLPHYVPSTRRNSARAGEGEGVREGIGQKLLSSGGMVDCGTWKRSQQSSRRGDDGFSSIF